MTGNAAGAGDSTWHIPVSAECVDAMEPRALQISSSLLVLT